MKQLSDILNGRFSSVSNGMKESMSMYLATIYRLKLSSVGEIVLLCWPVVAALVITVPIAIITGNIAWLLLPALAGLTCKSLEPMTAFQRWIGSAKAVPHIGNHKSWMFNQRYMMGHSVSILRYAGFTHADIADFLTNPTIQDYVNAFPSESIYDITEDGFVDSYVEKFAILVVAARSQGVELHRALELFELGVVDATLMHSIVDSNVAQDMLQSILKTEMAHGNRAVSHKVTKTSEWYAEAAGF